MDSKVFQNLKAKQISESSLNLYMKNLLRLNDNQTIKNLNFLKDIDSILERIKEKKPNTRRTYIISIVSLLKQEPKMKSLYDKYYALLIDYNKELKVNTEKTESQKENWLTQEGVKEVYDKLTGKVQPCLSKKKLMESEYEDVVSWIVLSLYVLQPPRRNLDYLYMMVVKKVSDLFPKEKNYLDLSDWTFYFNNYKTQKTYKTQSVPIAEEMEKVLKRISNFILSKVRLVNRILQFL